MRIAIAAAALLLTYAHADAQDACKPPGWRAMSAEFATEKFRVVELSVPQRALMQDDYNAIEPKSDEHFAHVFTVKAPDEAKLLVVMLGDDECILHYGPISAERLAKALTPPDAL